MCLISFGSALTHYLSLKLTSLSMGELLLPDVDPCSTSLGEIPLVTIAILAEEPVPVSLCPCLLPHPLETIHCVVMKDSTLLRQNLHSQVPL